MNNTLGTFDVVIVGAGFSGLLCAGYLREAGVANIQIFEMTSSVGGVWAKDGVGSYPGAACDVPSYAYLPLLDQTGFIPTKKYVTHVMLRRVTISCIASHRMKLRSNALR